MDRVRDAIVGGTPAEELAGIAAPESYRAVTVHKDEADMFAGLPSNEKDPRRSLHLDGVPTPELAPGEALIAVMASSSNYNTVWSSSNYNTVWSSSNYNTVWTSIFEPVSTFGFLERCGRTHDYAKWHDLPYHLIGSDAARVVLRVGPGVTAWKPGGIDRVVRAIAIVIGAWHIAGQC